ncbi:BufA2 family periplasmic bufferin-type metallophore [Sphingomonas sp. RS6]
MITIQTGASIAATAALVALSGASVAAPAAAGEKVVHCYGINSCKGTSDCKTANNDCKGQNSCKGQGFKAITAKACKAQGGSLTEPK